MDLRVKEICKQKGVQLKDVAEKMGIAKESLSRAINGNPQLSTLSGIAEALGVDVRELLPAPHQNNVTGYLEYRGEVIKITNTNDLLELVERIKSDPT